MQLSSCSPPPPPPYPETLELGIEPLTPSTLGQGFIKKKIPLQIAFLLHSSSHSKKEEKKIKNQKASSKKAVGSKLPPAKELRSDMEKLGKKKNKRRLASHATDMRGKKTPSGLENVKDLKEMSPKLPPVTRTEISYSYKFLNTTLHFFEVSFSPENYPSLPLRNRITSVTTKFKFMCPTSIFYFLIHLSGTAFNAFGFFFCHKIFYLFPSSWCQKSCCFL